MERIKDVKGITLVALVITIIVLLILAGITINLTIGKRGIVEKAQEIGMQYLQEQAREKLELAVLDLNSKKLAENNRQVLLEELHEINEKGITIKLDESNQVKISLDEVKNMKFATAYVDGFEFRAYENLEIVLVGKNGPIIEISELDKLREKYVQEGLLVWYDGIYNIKNGHSNNATIWENLAPISEVNQEGKNDGILMNVDFSQTSGWTDKALILDGENDWVKMSYIHYENMTVEIVAKPLDIDTTKQQCYISNFQGGGIGINKGTNNYNFGRAYIEGEYKDSVSKKNTQIGQIYSMSMGYNGNNVYYRENEDIYKITVTGTMGAPQDATIFAIGTDPKGTEEGLGTKETRANIEVYSIRIYNRCLTDEEIQKNYETDKQRFQIEELPEPEKLKYVENGLICHYDGEQNTLYGHSRKNPIWMDLSGNKNDGILMNVDFSQTSGWTDKALILDGENDWVKMSYIHYENMTVEIVAKPLDIDTTKQQCYIGNFQGGGIGINKGTNNYNFGRAYIEGEYKDSVSKKNTQIGQIYSMSMGYNGNNVYYRENEDIYKITVTGTMGAPQDATIFAIGTDPKGTEEGLGTKETRANIEVYSIRIYNRCLTDEEIQNNYEIDKQRFNI